MRNQGGVSLQRKGIVYMSAGERSRMIRMSGIVAIFYPLKQQFCESEKGETPFASGPRVSVYKDAERVREKYISNNFRGIFGTRTW